MNILKTSENQEMVIKGLVEGSSIRSIERMTEFTEIPSCAL
jgi:hypothetical protein